MPWSLFGRSRDDRPHQAWWQQADTIAGEPSAAGIAALRESIAAADAWPDEADRQLEFLEGLERLADLRAATRLPDIPTQHRVIASDRCHFIAPVSLVGPADVAGKLFLTSNRVIFVGASVVSWPWHRVRAIARQDRDLVLTIVGGADLFVLRCNTYGDALEAGFLAEILASAASRGGGSRT
jgi:hypothetical protein